MSHNRLFTVLTTIAAVLVSVSANAGIWTEIGDAGQNGIATAQVTTSVTPLTSIQGVLNNGVGGLDVDVYAIQITDYQNFSAIATSALDTMLYLFKADGTGQVMNDDYIGYNGGLTNQGVFSNGLYYLAISRFNNRPLDAASNVIFSSTPWPGPLNNQMQPNSGTGAYLSWTGTTPSRGGGYEIFLTGVNTPAPGGLALLGFAALAGTRRRSAV